MRGRKIPPQPERSPIQRHERHHPDRQPHPEPRHQPHPAPPLDPPPRQHHGRQQRRPRLQPQEPRCLRRREQHQPEQQPGRPRPPQRPPPPRRQQQQPHYRRQLHSIGLRMPQLEFRHHAKAEHERHHRADRHRPTEPAHQQHHSPKPGRRHRPECDVARREPSRPHRPCHRIRHRQQKQTVRQPQRMWRRPIPPRRPPIRRLPRKHPHPMLEDRQHDPAIAIVPDRASMQRSAEHRPQPRDEQPAGHPPP